MLELINKLRDIRKKLTDILDESYKNNNITDNALNYAEIAAKNILYAIQDLRITSKNNSQ